MKHSFIDILDQKIEIPIIQRDFAQGRHNKTVDKIRFDFLNALFVAIENKILSPDAQLELDFIYGFIGKSELGNTFIPIDGQQRLTTLWLLYWFVACKEEEDEPILSNFIYETRYSSTVFCQELVHFKPKFKKANIADEIRDQSWYFETWDFDPTIQSMLVVLTDIEKKYENLTITPVWTILTESGGPFFFYKLNMNEVGLTDDLYIKMNSRGKPLTEFEYFKASFTAQISNIDLKKRFEKSIDQHWIECVWKLILESKSEIETDDIALIVDHSFLNLFNFLTSILASKKGITYINTYESKEDLSKIYRDDASYVFVFDILDAVCNQLENEPNYWNNLFYFDKNSYQSTKCRLYFLHTDTNLLKRCLLHYHINRGFSLQEQVLLYSCLTNLLHPNQQFNKLIRTIRNITINSDFQLRNESISENYKEIESFIQSKDYKYLKTFKTDQIQEEIEKETFIFNEPRIADTLHKLEDSDLLRGSISIFNFESYNFEGRAKQFLLFFEEDDFSKNFAERSNALLTFGNYGQNDGGWFNLMSANKTIIRKFFTTPGYGSNKDLYKISRPIIMQCLDHFKNNSKVQPQDIVNKAIAEMKTNGRDWRYYFFKYPSFRNSCNKGFYYRFTSTEEFVFNKMKEKQFNGFNWCPFLAEVNEQISSKKMSISNYNGALEISKYKSLVGIRNINNGFKFENLNKDNRENWMIGKLRELKIVNKNDIVEIPQNQNFTDKEDRIKILVSLSDEIINWKKE